MTVPLSLTLASPLTVSDNSNNVLDLEFDLNNPTLIIEHEPVGAAAPTWVVNFNGPVRHHPRPDPTKIILRHHYGQVTSVSQDNTSIAMNPAYPVYPVTSPETAIVDANNTLTVLADSTNGTLYYDLDSSTAPSTITNFSSIASVLPRLFVRIAARYQQDGTLVATRIYSSGSFDKIWRNPEGHVLHVNTTNNTMWVTTDDGKAMHIAIGSNTAFYFQAGDAAIGAGTAFFDGTTPGGLPNLPRGFKVDVTIDPLSTTTPPTALSVEIDTARYDGAISSPTDSDFEDTRTFAMADGRGGKDDYSGTIDYSTGANVDQRGNAVTGFYWWNFAYPTLDDTGSSAVTDFVSATGGSVNFGGTAGALKVRGLTQATWNDPVATDTWAARWTILTPVGAPLGAHFDGILDELGQLCLHRACGRERAYRNADSASGYRGLEHDERQRDAGLPGGPAGRRHHHNAAGYQQLVHAGHRGAEPHGRRAGEGVRGAAGGRKPESIRVVLLHAHGIHSVIWAVAGRRRCSVGAAALLLRVGLVFAFYSPIMALSCSTRMQVCPGPIAR